MVRVEWNPVKDAVNRKKHQVSFEEAAGLFSSKRPWLDLDDEAHSGDNSVSRDR